MKSLPSEKAIPLRRALPRRPSLRFCGVFRRNEKGAAGFSKPRIEQIELIPTLPSGGSPHALCGEAVLQPSMLTA